VLVEKLFEVDDVVQVGQTIAVIEIAGKEFVIGSSNAKTETVVVPAQEVIALVEAPIVEVTSSVVQISDTRFYSPLVKNIIASEGISQQELDTISGSGKDGRVTKNDILKFIENLSSQFVKTEVKQVITKTSIEESKAASAVPVSVNGGDEIMEMSRMGKLIAHHMVESVQTAAHVQSFIEADVTNIWNWRKKVKDGFSKREGENLTFTPIFLEAVAKALKDYPMLNISIDGDKIIKRKNINIGMAAALADGNLIVPVIKNADQLNLVGMSKAVNDLAKRARSGKLKPDDIQGGTYTVTNVGTFGSIMGTPIINQPQVGILALGAIRKVPAVIETPDGDFIGIRFKMFLSHSYDHRVVNGALGGQFVKAVADYLEAWDVNREL
ncbi:MAG: 2-oxo acid dehydrogenase subunit E2, partial [Flavobacteriaceae bacterium]|nr:2-oxo acid dehydrogenase subunit E2 [Flavobacteriaceae bacterium]